MEVESLVSSSSSEMSEPLMPPDSPGSSVSSRMQEEYDELLKYAVIVPSFDPNTLPKTLRDLKESFPLMQTNQTEDEGPEEEDSLTDVEEDDRESEVGVRDAADQTGLHIGFTTEESPPAQISREEFKEWAKGRPMRFSLDNEEADSTLGSRASTQGSFQTTEKVVTYSIDPDVARMETLLEEWTTDLKRNVLAEFGQSKIKVIEHHRIQMCKEKEKHAAEVTKLQNDMEGLKELLHTYEQSIERKDQVISNLTHGMQKQKDRLDMLKTFCQWKIKHNDMKREAFASNLAKKHHERKVQQKCWDAWHAIVEARWRSRVEKACQAKAQEVCMTLTNDYETRIASLNEALEAARTEVLQLHAEREKYEETMKKAFMRGVCALNLEAMTMFHEPDTQDGRTQESTGENGNSGGCQETDEYYPPGFSATIQQEAVYSSEPPGAPLPRVITSQSACRHTSSSGYSTQAKHQTGVKVKSSSKSKVISAKVTARTDSGRSAFTSSGGGTLAPPMSSVVVERHPPINKQTLGHATASRYPLAPSQPTIIHRKIAGQTGEIHIATPNVQTVKVVD